MFEDDHLYEEPTYDPPPPPPGRGPNEDESRFFFSLLPPPLSIVYYINAGARTTISSFSSSSSSPFTPAFAVLLFRPNVSSAPEDPVPPLKAYCNIFRYAYDVHGCCYFSPHFFFFLFQVRTCGRPVRCTHIPCTRYAVTQLVEIPVPDESPIRTPLHQKSRYRVFR